MVQHKKHPAIRSILLLISSLLTFIVALFIDLTILDISLLAEKPPDFGFWYLCRTVLIILSSGLFVFFILYASKGSKNSQLRVPESWRKQGLIISGVLFLSTIFLGIYLFSPRIFYILCTEGLLVESTSATLYFLNCFLFLYIASLLYKHSKYNKIIHLTTALLFACVFFVIGMEEISWLQQILSFKTPALFSKNIQGEVSLHNFASDQFENVYYFASFAFLILIPFLGERISILKQKPIFSFFWPSPFILFASAIMVAYNYDMWNILFIQLSFFITLFIIVYYAWSHINMDYNPTFLFLIIAVITSTQILYILFGERFVRLWDITEYKEFFIPLSFLFFSLEVLQKAKIIRESNICKSI